jgi:hypothetical protein
MAIRRVIRERQLPSGGRPTREVLRATAPPLSAPFDSPETWRPSGSYAGCNADSYLVGGARSLDQGGFINDQATSWQRAEVPEWIVKGRTSFVTNG